LATACSAGSIWLGGCYGATPLDRDDSSLEISLPDLIEIIEQQPPLPDEENVPVPGGERAPMFNCGSLLDWGEYWAPAYLDGSLCNDQPALASFHIAEEGRYRVNLTDGAEAVLLTVIDPEGVEVATLSPDVTSLELELATGQWVLSATPTDPDINPYTWFAVNIERAEP
jgi:hypothetical protein